jgi:hypothetical protein
MPKNEHFNFNLNTHMQSLLAKEGAWFELLTDRISGKVWFRPDIRLHFPVPVPVWQRKTDFCRKMFAF